MSVTEQDMLPQETCPSGGPDHEPFPRSYLSASEYADLLMFEGWEQPHACSGCGLWKVWTHPDGRTKRPAWPPVNDDHLAYDWPQSQ